MFSGRVGLTDGPSQYNLGHKLGQFFREVSRIRTLEKAWRKVRSRGLISASKDIRAEVIEFDLQPNHHLRSIQATLVAGTFKFAPQVGVAKKRKGKTPRPIVVAPIRNRIIQRAILDVLSSVPKIKSIQDIPTSVGGIAGVDAAIALAMEAIGNGAIWYVRSDIPGFFTKIPKHEISEFINEATGDIEFAKLFDEAMAVELANSEALSEYLSIFPTGNIGIAQGSALSPLIGNILLRDFDKKMNSRGIVCIRYIDDFLILGSNKAHVVKAFNAAKGMLATYGMDAYSPEERPDKASMGDVADGFTFLGCFIKSGLIQPSKDAKNNLIENVRVILKEGRSAMDRAKDGTQKIGQRYVQTLTRLDRVLKGWGDAFAFCNGRQVFSALDKRIDRELFKFRAHTQQLIHDAPADVKRRIIGVYCLSDTERKNLSSRTSSE